MMSVGRNHVLLHHLLMTVELQIRRHLHPCNQTETSTFGAIFTLDPPRFLCPIACGWLSRVRLSVDRNDIILAPRYNAKNKCVDIWLIFNNPQRFIFQITENFEYLKLTLPPIELMILELDFLFPFPLVISCAKTGHVFSSNDRYVKSLICDLAYCCDFFNHIKAKRLKRALPWF